MLTLTGTETVLPSMPADRPDDPSLFALVDVDGAVCVHQWDKRSIFPRQTLKWKPCDPSIVVAQLRQLADAIEDLDASGGGRAQAEGGTAAAASGTDLPGLGLTPGVR